MAEGAIAPHESAPLEAPRGGLRWRRFCVCRLCPCRLRNGGCDSFIRRRHFRVFVLRFGQSEMAPPIGIEYLKSEGGGDIQFSCIVHGHSICAFYFGVRWGMHVEIGLAMGE